VFSGPKNRVEINIFSQYDNNIKGYKRLWLCPVLNIIIFCLQAGLGLLKTLSTLNF
jgi:hypothetical protein